MTVSVHMIMYRCGTENFPNGTKMDSFILKYYEIIFSPLILLSEYFLAVYFPCWQNLGCLTNLKLLSIQVGNLADGFLYFKNIFSFLVSMLWFNLTFVTICFFPLFNIHHDIFLVPYIRIKIVPRVKLNHNIYVGQK